MSERFEKPQKGQVVHIKIEAGVSPDAMSMAPSSSAPRTVDARVIHSFEGFDDRLPCEARVTHWPRPQRAYFFAHAHPVMRQPAPIFCSASVSVAPVSRTGLPFRL